MLFVIHYTRPTLIYKWKNNSEIVSIELMDETEALSIQPVRLVLYLTTYKQCITGRTFPNIQYVLSVLLFWVIPT
jgi:hypothetical protein